MAEKRVDRFTFKLTDLLGEGVDDKTKEVVAIKMLSKNLINADEYLREGLMNEIKIMQSLAGINVVRLLDVLETSNNYYIVQEFCDGGDLQGQLKKKKILSQNEAIKLFVDVLLGFMELVKKGIIHRDLKPANILINKGVYKIADFGFSKAIGNFQREMLTSAVGTPLYMSPQILKSQKYTSKSDVWSLGFIFFEAIFGQTPWTAKSIPELIKNIKTIPLSFPTHVQVDKPYLDLIKGCLQIQEVERLGWDQIFRHPCFGTTFQYYMDKSKLLEDKAIFLVNDLRFKIMKDKIDMEDIFKKYDQSGDQNLDMPELTKLLHEINPELERDEIEYIFNKIDEDGSNSIDINEFKKWLEANQVRMSMKPQSNYGKQVSQETIAEMNQQPPISPPLQQFAQAPQYQQQMKGSNSGQYNNQQPQFPPGQQQYPGLQQQFPGQQPQYPVQQQYNQPPPYSGQYTGPYPPQNQVQMKGSQGQGNMGSAYYPNTDSQFSQQQQHQQYNQVPPAYQQYPMQGSNHSQQYPQQGYGYNNNAPYNAYQQNLPQNQSAQDRALLTIQKLILAIEKYNINIWELFKKYDKTDSSTLDMKEFGIMLRRIDSNLTDIDISQAFWLFDVDKSNEITFKEFKDGIEYNINLQKTRNIQNPSGQYPGWQQQPLPQQYNYPGYGH